MILWKIYFWVFSSIVFLGLVLEIFIRPGYFTNVFDALNILFMAIGLVGVYGFAYKKEVGPKTLWLPLLIINVVYQIAYSFVLDQKFGSAPAGSTLEGLITFVPLIPMYIALALYIVKKK